jgi:hypothetical protein
MQGGQFKCSHAHVYSPFAAVGATGGEQEEKVAGPFTTTAELAGGDKMERWEVCVNQVFWQGAMKMIVRTLVILLAIVVTEIPAGAQNPSSIVGTWRVVSFEREIVETKAVSQGFGRNAMGLMTLTPDGRASVIIVDAKRKPPARPTATDAEAVDLFRTMNVFAGTYRVQGDDIIMHIEISSEQTTTGTDYTRSFKLDGDRLTTIGRQIASAFLNNQTTVTTVVYERVNGTTR